jgi:hypothetical protein
MGHPVLHLLDSQRWFNLRHRLLPPRTRRHTSWHTWARRQVCHAAYPSRPVRSFTSPGLPSIPLTCCALTARVEALTDAWPVAVGQLANRPRTRRSLLASEWLTSHGVEISTTTRRLRILSSQSAKTIVCVCVGDSTDSADAAC